MEIREYLRILRRRLWIPIVLVFAGVMVMGAVTLLSRPEYIATSTVVAKSQNTGSTIPSLSFQEVATSNNLALRVRRELGLSDSVDQLTSRITVSPGRSDLYKIAVTDANSDRATALANVVAKDAAELYQALAAGSPGAIVKDLKGDQEMFRDQYLTAAKNLLDYSQQHPEATVGCSRPGVAGELVPCAAKDTAVGAEYLRLQLDEHAASQAYLDFQSNVAKARVDESANARNFQATVVDDAVAKPDTTSRFLKIGYAAALALIVGIVVIVALECMDNSVRDPQEVEEVFGAPVVGMIPSANVRTWGAGRGSAR